MIEGPILADWTLSMAAEIVSDLERTKGDNANRLRQLTDTSELGFGLTVDHPAVRQLQILVDQLAATEAAAVKNLEKAMKQHPLGPWMASQKGVGAKQCARLLAAIRDPYWQDAEDRPRTLRELWSLSGMGLVAPGGGQVGEDAIGVAPTKRKGERVSWNPEARQRVWLIASKTIMFRDSPGRAIYDVTRLKYADAVHATECKRCGPKGKPALPGSDLSPGHQHARALRAVAKEILRGLWIEARALHHADEVEISTAA